MHTHSEHSEPERGANGSAFLDHCRNVARCHDGFAALIEENDTHQIQFVGELLERRKQLVQGIMSGMAETEMAELAIAVAAGLFELSEQKVGPQAGAMNMLLQKLVEKDGSQIMEVLRGLDAAAEPNRLGAKETSARAAVHVESADDFRGRIERATGRHQIQQQAHVMGEFYVRLAQFLEYARPEDVELYGELFYDYQNAGIYHGHSPAAAALAVLANIHEAKDRDAKEKSLSAIVSVAEQLSVEALAGLARRAQALADQDESSAEVSA